MIPERKMKGMERVIQKRRGSQHKGHWPVASVCSGDSLLWDLSEENSFQFVCSEDRKWGFIHQLKIASLVINSSEQVRDPKAQEKTQG